MEMDKAKIETRFGLDPESVGLRHRAYWIVETVDYEEAQAGAKVGDLCVKARDGGGNDPDLTAGSYPNFRGTACDGFDRTYRYYYYAPLGEEDGKAD